MGNESSIFEDCEWESSTSSGLWTIHQGKLADDTEITRFNVSKNDKKHYDVMRKLTKNLKLVRHPSILAYIYSEEGSHGPELITEKAVPLEDIIPSLSSTEVCAGLHSVLDTLRFLHEKVGSSHNNIHTGAVYVTSDGSWRLGGLEHMCKFSECSSSYLESSKLLRNESTITPEEKEGKVSTDESLAHARDIYAFAVMTESLFERLDDLGDLTKTFELRIQDECLNSDPRYRPKAESLLDDRIFNTEFLEIALFLKNITLKSEQERRIFFRNLHPKLLSQPEELTARRLVPAMLSRFVFLDQSAVENVLPSILTPRKDDATSETAHGLSPLFSAKVFKQFIVPKLVRIFGVHDYHVHIILLQYFPSYVHLIDKEDLELDVFPQVLLGLRDTSDQISSLSLHALAEMVPILGRDVVIGGKSKTYFKEGLPKSQSLLPNNKYSNVRGTVEKIRLADLVKERDNGRPITISKKDDDADKKWKEKEQRREEMRRKREERKLAREKSKASMKKDMDNTMDKPDSPRNITDLNHSSDIQLNTSNDSQAENSSNLDVSHAESNERSDENFDEEPEESVEHVENTNDVDDDWTGWSDEDVASNYSEEIEKELENMESNSIILNETDTSPISRNDKISISKNSKQGALKLMPKTSKSDKKKPEAELEVDKLVDDTKRKTQSVKPSPSVSAKTNDGLGSEFDIMNLDIKVSKPAEDPFDFFADMAPKIETKKPNVQETFTEKVDDTVTDKTGEPSKTQISFNVRAENMEDNDAGGGWGDDEDW